MHLRCIDTPLNLIVDEPINKFYVFSSKTVNQIRNTLLQLSKDPEIAMEELYINHPFENLYHVCNSCQIHLGIQKIKNHTKHQVLFQFIFGN